MEDAKVDDGKEDLRLEYIESPRFNFEDPKEAAEGVAFLEENGYVIAANVLNEPQIKAAKDLFWDFVEGYPKRMEQVIPGFEKECGKIDRNDPTTWNDDWPGDPVNGIMGRYGMGHSPFVWSVRSNPKVIRVFEKVWKTDNLLTSFDAANAFRPWRFDSTWRTKGGWFHVDQNPNTKPGRVCVQGLVSLYDTTEEVGGLTVIPQSHKLFKDLPQTMDIA